MEKLFATSELFPGESMPVTVLQPQNEAASSLDSLVELIKEHRAEFKQALVQQGIMLLRGFNINTSPEFERVALAISPNMQDEYLGTSPRTLQPGCDFVFSASEFPWYIPIPQHCEISFTKNPPRTIAFCCLGAPKLGGQTTICDFRKVYRDLSPELREKWQEKGLRMLRSYGEGSSTWEKIDPFAVKRWDEVFQTKDKKKVEEVCQREEYDAKWDNTTLRLANRRPAYIVHPETKDPVWFNHAHIFDYKMIPAEFKRIRAASSSGRWKSPVPNWIFFLLQLFATIVLFVKSLFIDDTHHPTHVQYGDGTPIPTKELEEVRDVIWRNHRYFNWQKGDVMVIDNFQISHGRMPYSGPRKVVVAWC